MVQGFDASVVQHGPRSEALAAMGASGGSAHHDTWNVFRRRDESDLWCAVPSDHSVPVFLLSGGWTFGGSSTSEDSQLPNIVRPDALKAVQLNGFYLFMSFDVEGSIVS